MNPSGVPIKLIKKEAVPAAAVVSPSSKKERQDHSHAPIEPHVQLVEVSPGVYDIVFTCKCGEKTVVRCNSLEAPSAAPAPTASVSNVPKKVAAAPVAPPASNEESAA